MNIFNGKRRSCSDDREKYNCETNSSKIYAIRKEVLVNAIDKGLSFKYSYICTYTHIYLNIHISTLKIFLGIF